MPSEIFLNNLYLSILLAATSEIDVLKEKNIEKETIRLFCPYDYRLINNIYHMEESKGCIKIVLDNIVNPFSLKYISEYNVCHDLGLNSLLNHISNIMVCLS